MVKAMDLHKVNKLCFGERIFSLCHNVCIQLFLRLQDCFAQLKNAISEIDIVVKSLRKDTIFLIGL